MQRWPLEFLALARRGSRSSCCLERRMRICVLIVAALIMLGAAQATKRVVPKPEVVTREQWGSDRRRCALLHAG